MNSWVLTSTVACSLLRRENNRTPCCVKVTAAAHRSRSKCISVNSANSQEGRVGEDSIYRNQGLNTGITREFLHLSVQFVQFSCSVMSDSLRPHGLQHARPPCPPPAPGICSNSCPLSQWCHPTISSSVIPFSSWPSIFPSMRAFSNESLLRMRWPNYCSFTFTINPSNE